MYPECRYVRPSGGTCNSPALKGSHWCYYHGGIQQRQAIRHSRRRADGRFTALLAPQPESNAIATVDYGTLPVATRTEASALHSAPLDLPPLEDTSSIQFALNEVVQALAANELEPKRAGLLLYALQVASTNVQKMHIPISDAVRTVTYTDDGAPLAPQDYGYDVEDYEDDDEDDDDDESE